jgi:hypothetical protein
MTFSVSRSGDVAQVRAVAADDIAKTRALPYNDGTRTQNALETLDNLVADFLDGREGVNASVSISGHISEKDDTSSYLNVSLSASPKPVTGATGNSPGFKPAPEAPAASSAPIVEPPPAPVGEIKPPAQHPGQRGTTGFHG